jgi:serine/threonine-protein kinase
MPDLVPGVTVAGRYRIDRKVGSGGMAEVWAAKNIAVGTEVAVKTLSLSASANAELVHRFRREAYLLACVRSDHVARVLDFACDDTYGHVLVLDLIQGETLQDVVTKRRISVEEAVDLMTDIARGMLDLHRASVVHRDLKPGNVILEDRPTGRWRAVIIDFGLGRLIPKDRGGEDMSGITSLDTALGTLEYMAPEQILNSRGATPPCDIYSLGAIIYRAVLGQHLFGDLTGAGLAQAKLNRDTPAFMTGRDDRTAKGLEKIVNRTLRRRPDERYQRTEDLLSDLMAIQRKRRTDIDDPTTDPMMDGGTVPMQPSPLRAPKSERRPGSQADVPATPAPAKGGTSLLLLFFTALGAMVLGALLGSTAERMRQADVREAAPPTASSSPPRALVAAPTAAAPTASASADPASADAPSAAPSASAPVVAPASAPAASAAAPAVSASARAPAATAAP